MTRTMGIDGNLGESVGPAGICEDMWESAGICMASHSEIF